MGLTVRSYTRKMSDFLSSVEHTLRGMEVCDDREKAGMSSAEAILVSSLLVASLAVKVMASCDDDEDVNCLALQLLTSHFSP